MRNIANPFLLAIVFSLVLSSCVAVPPLTVTEAAIILATASPALITPTLTNVPSTATLTPIPKGETFVVTSTEDSGAGTLREALRGASPGDIITFDGSVFPISNPQTIYLRSNLPYLEQGYLTIDAEAAGVILDGSQFPEGWDSAIIIVSNYNIVRGLTLVNFSGAALHISGGQNNLIEGNTMGNSDFGIGIWGANATGNVVTANYLGVMPDGVSPIGNRAAGVIVTEEAHDNRIGPGNQIAFNKRGGVEIDLPSTDGNTIIENSIHDNGWQGIFLMSGSNNNILAPLLMDLDLPKGALSGRACPHCDVSIYSDASDEGAIFEGQTIADENGFFTFEKGSPFIEQYITATSTDLQGNTSEFSWPTTRISRSVAFQEGNTFPKIPIQPLRSNQLADNRIGAVVGWPPACWVQYLDDELFSLGAKRVKVSISELEPESVLGNGTQTVDWSRSEFTVSEDQENCIQAMLDNDITITYILSFWDKANHPDGWEPAVSRFRTQEEIQAYLDYVRAIVRYFKGRIRYYEIWNEPNNKPPLQWIQMEDYMNLVEQTIPVITQEDPEAKIVIGSVVLQNEEDRSYLSGLLKSEWMPLVDVISWHAMFGVSPDYISEYYYEYSTIVESIKKEAAAHGFKGEYWADELIWRDPDCYWCYPGDPLYSNIVSAKYHARGIVIQLGMGLTTQVTGNSALRPNMFFAVNNLATVLAGNTPLNLPVEVQTTAAYTRSYGFSLPNGDRLLAVWNDGVAVDDDSGISTTIMIPDVASWTATGIDVLSGIEQELVTDSENGSLVIRDFLLKDYPIIIRLSK